MSRNYLPRPLRIQRGFSLVLALFVIMICGLLATALINTNTINADAVAREVLSSRALLAAESAAQRGAQEVTPATCNTLGNTWGANWAAPGCAASINCTAVTADGTTYFTLNAVGSCGPAGDNAQRSIRAIVRERF